jgi:meso-butanediol dehydrogenase / (S,S)-butanediol dehydrogenase / diacetyl reductase
VKESERKNPEFVLVSGAAGGVGSAAARRFAAEGARVAITDINADQLKVVAKEIGALALPADGTNRDELADVVSRTIEEFGALDTVIAAQGAAISGPANRRGDKAFFTALDVNLHGAYFLTTEAVPHLVEREGSVVMIASSAGLFAGPPGTVGYTVAKSGIIGLVRWLARDLGPRGVRVNGVCPGWVRTALGGGAMEYLAKHDDISIEEAYRRTTQHTPLRRPAEPSEIASVCSFLASSDASMVTGHALMVDGGGSAVDLPTAIFDINATGA